MGGGGTRPPLALRATPSLFHTSRMVERLGNALHGNDDILFYNEDFDKSHSLLIKDIFLVQVLIKLILIMIIILMKTILIQLFMSNFRLDVVT